MIFKWYELNSSRCITNYNLQIEFVRSTQLKISKHLLPQPHAALEALEAAIKNDSIQPGLELVSVSLISHPLSFCKL
jgi:hypothetical protein